MPIFFSRPMHSTFFFFSNVPSGFTMCRGTRKSERPFVDGFELGRRASTT
jgi:hypothetical protein